MSIVVVATLTKQKGQSKKNVSGRTLVVSPVTVTVTNALVKGVAPSMPEAVPVCTYVMGAAWAKGTNPDKARIKTAARMNDTILMRVSPQRVCCGEQERFHFAEVRSNFYNLKIRRCLVNS